MSRTILITGGGASGKSRWAISQFEACDNVLYLCPDPELDADTMKRIEYGNKKNYVQWDLHTGVCTEPYNYFNKHKFAIFDNLSAYTSKVIEEMCPDISQLDAEMEKKIEGRIIDDVVKMHEAMNLIEGDIIVITLEMGFSILPEQQEQIAFRKILGMVNQRIANVSTDVYLSASGIQFRIK